MKRSVISIAQFLCDRWASCRPN